MSWNLDGSYFETCSCELVCPCTASLANGATYDRCKVVLVFRVKSGQVEGTDVGGLTVAAVADTPKVMTDGNWRLGVVIDEAASDEQAEKLGGVFSGALGGPMEALGPLVGENLGMERQPIEVREEGLTHSVRIGDQVDFEIEDIVPFGVSATAATVSLLTSVPSTSPLLTLKTRTTLQRSLVAPSESDAVHGQTTSHEQLSKYEPDRFQDISPPPDVRPRSRSTLSSPVARVNRSCISRPPPAWSCREGRRRSCRRCPPSAA